MRWAWLVVVGCGRVAFDPVASDPVVDGAADTAMGAPCMAVGHDEDGDGVDDACDGCPHIPDPAQPDGDGDRVDDACDPRPTLAGEQIVFFDGFVGGARPEWMLFPAAAATFPSDGTFDSLRVDTRMTSFFMQRDAAPMRDVFTIGGRLGANDAMTTQITVQVAEAPSARTYYCELFDAPALLALTSTLDAMTYVNEGSVPLTGPLANGAFMLTMNHGSQVTCATSWPPGTSVTAPQPSGISANLLESVIAGVVVDLDYAVQIHTP